MGVGNSGQQFSPEIMPGIVNPASTGAGEGSQGGQVTPSVGNLASVPVSVVGISSQIAQPVVRVDYSDTAGGSSDSPSMLMFGGTEQTSAAWISPAGHVSGDRHPGPGQ
jgi:hypothetical protein